MISNVQHGAAAPETAAAVIGAALGGVTIINDREAEVVDANGRRIKVKRIGAIQRMNLFRIVGAEASANPQYMSYVIIGASVTAIGGEPLLFPTNILQIESVISRLDDHGVEAATRGLVALTPADKEAIAEAAKNLS